MLRRQIQNITVKSFVTLHCHLISNKKWSVHKYISFVLFITFISQKKKKKINNF